MPASIRKAGSNLSHSSNTMFRRVARSVLLLTFTLTIALPASAVPLKGAKNPLKKDIDGLIDKCVVSGQRKNITDYEIKANWQEKELGKVQSFHRGSNNAPNIVTKKGFDPMKNNEAVFKQGKNGAPEIFKFKPQPLKETCMFVFAMPNEFSGKSSGALKRFWPKHKYVYQFKLPKGTYYASDHGKVTAKVEIAFPKPIYAKQITHVWELKGSKYELVYEQKP